MRNDLAVAELVDAPRLEVDPLSVRLGRAEDRRAAGVRAGHARAYEDLVALADEVEDLDLPVRERLHRALVRHLRAGEALRQSRNAARILEVRSEVLIERAEVVAVPRLLDLADDRLVVGHVQLSSRCSWAPITRVYHHDERGRRFSTRAWRRRPALQR